MIEEQVNRLEDIIVDLSKAVKRDEVLKRITFLSILSAWAEHPINLFLKGPSSTGKTYNVTSAAKYLPKDRIMLLGGLSPTALVHDFGKLVDEDGKEFQGEDAPRKDQFKIENEKGRMIQDPEAFSEAQREWKIKLDNSHYRVELGGSVLIFLEAPNEETFMRLKPILSHDAEEISFKFADRPGGGRLRTMHVKLCGWPAAIFCTTETEYLDELATRSVTFTPDMSGDEYNDAIRLLGSRASEPWLFDFVDPETEALKKLIIKVIDWKKHADKVLTPFAKDFTYCYKASKPRDMRDVRYVLNFISTSTMLHYDLRPILTMHRGDQKMSYVMSNYLDLYNAASVLIHVWEATQTGISEHCINVFYDVIIPRYLTLGKGVPIQKLMEDYEAQGIGTAKRKVFYKWLRALEDIGWIESVEDPEDRRRKLITVTKADKNNSLLLAIDKFKAQFTPDLIKEQILRLIKYSPPTKLSLRETLESPEITLFEHDEINPELSSIITKVFGETYFSGLERLEINKEAIKELEISQETKRTNLENKPKSTVDRELIRNLRDPEEQSLITTLVEAAQEVKKNLPPGELTFPRIQVYQELKPYANWQYETFAKILQLALNDRVVFEDSERQGYIGVIDDY